MLLDRIKKLAEKERAEKERAEQQAKAERKKKFMEQYVYRIANNLKDKNYFEKVWKKYKFSVAEGTFDFDGTDGACINVEVAEDSGEDCGISVDITFYCHDHISCSLIPYDYSDNTENLEEPFVAYGEWYEVALNGDVLNSQQEGDFDKLLIELERITNKKVAKQVKIELEKTLVEHYDDLLKITNKEETK